MSKVDLAKGPYTITSTASEGESYTLGKDNRTHVGKSPFYTSGFWNNNGKGDDNSLSGATACTEKPEEVKASDIPYDEYMEVVYENEMLKKIIIELNKKLYGWQNDK